MFKSTYEVPATTLLIVCDIMDCRHFKDYGLVDIQHAVC